VRGARCEGDVGGDCAPGWAGRRASMAQCSRVILLFPHELEEDGGRENYEKLLAQRGGYFSVFELAREVDAGARQIVGQSLVAR